MALAAISGILSTTILGGIILALVVLILRSMWKKKKAGGGLRMQLWLQRLRAWLPYQDD